MRSRVLFRGTWFALAALTMAYAIVSGLSPVATISMSCGKIGELSPFYGRSGFTCTDSILDAVGLVPVALLGILLAAPPVIAGVALNRNVSLCAAVALGFMAIFGLLNWTGFWVLMLMGALPAAVFAAIVAALQPHFRRPVASVSDRVNFAD
ncbi:hypothetical protein [Rhodococcus sp. 14-2470-1a]|uniref:hypothetical protein n=1 Tax=Rhodococcus sp. 14-2470-1a TaxID=2023150 RepID=UPI000B9C4796|nr:MULTISPECIES: hypothetical protein [unclassified Rhodococcus (in: high G+C Gram-positive bacteria)]OZE84883.1 hypothetical protein CH304_06880 [Rhodococcus sp. 15-649-1-2]OZF55454.1 hypothetical protein CH292_05725 [Rhodococcus sp. 14-2470-1a]